MNREQIIEHYKGFFGIDRVTTEADSVLIDWAEALLQEQKPVIKAVTKKLDEFMLAWLKEHKNEINGHTMNRRCADEKHYDGSGVDWTKIDKQGQTS